jgi:MinD-like ATPase involved in chromosome partitioning or flagellar assembly
MSKQLNLVINGKGGVEKSFFAINLITYLLDQRIGHIAVDTDHENSTLKRFHPQAEFVDIDRPP